MRIELLAEEGLRKAGVFIFGEDDPEDTSEEAEDIREEEGTLRRVALETAKASFEHGVRAVLAQGKPVVKCLDCEDDGIHIGGLGGMHHADHTSRKIGIFIDEKILDEMNVEMNLK